MGADTWSRREFMRALGMAAAGAPLLSWSACVADSALPDVLLVSATDDVSGGHHITGFAVAADVAFELSVPVRCHASARHPVQPHVAMVARRPGSEIYIVDANRGVMLGSITAPAERHYFGHAVFDRQGRRLYATENVFDDSPLPDVTPRDAVIGVYDVDANYARIAELPAHGVGAHEIGILDDGTLVVANGGIYTHPSRPREDLDIATMDPSLAYIDAGTGDLVAQHRLPDHQLSIRHMAIGVDGDVAIGLQYHGDSGTRVPLVAWQRSRDDALVPLSAPEDAWDALDHYIASVAIHHGTRTVAATSPVGGQIAFWDVETGAYRSAIPAADVSGIVATDTDFIATAGTGTIYVIDARELRVRRELYTAGVRWDNHVRVEDPQVP